METGSLPAGPRGRTRPGGVAALAAALLIYMGSAPVSATEVPGSGASGTRVLEAADNAELRTAIPASGVSRVALLGDRVARIIRAPGGLRVEHDPASGDLYLHPGDGEDAAGAAGSGPPVLFIGTERGFTYRLSLVPAPAGAAQILIRNPAIAASASPPDRTAGEGDDRVGMLVGLIRAVVRGEPLPGYTIGAEPAVSPGGAASIGGLAPLETWRGPHFTALAFRLGAAMTDDAAALAAHLGPGLAAAWISAPSGAGARLAVAVRENAAGETR